MKTRETFEKTLIKEFKRKCHLFVENPPEEERRTEWMALMQHHGAPTRLLDCTYSFFIQLVPILVPSSELNNIIYTDIKINP